MNTGCTQQTRVWCWGNRGSFPQEQGTLSSPWILHFCYSSSWLLLAQFDFQVSNWIHKIGGWKEIKPCNVLTEQACFGIAQIVNAELHETILNDFFFFPEYILIFKILQQIHNSNPTFCFRMEFQPYQLIKATTWSELAFKLISFVSLIHTH